MVTNRRGRTVECMCIRTIWAGDRSRWRSHRDRVAHPGRRYRRPGHPRRRGGHRPVVRRAGAKRLGERYGARRRARGEGRGITGELVVDVRTDDPDRFAPGGVLLLKPRDASRAAVRVVVQSVRPHGDGCWSGWMVSPTAMPPGVARRVVRHRLPRSCRRSPTPTSSTITSTRGARRAHRRRPRSGFGDRSAVTPRRRVAVGARRRRSEVLVPFVSAIVTTVSLADGVIEIDPPEGLLDLD